MAKLSGLQESVTATES